MTMSHEVGAAAAATLEVRLPDLGEGLTEATIVRWLVAPGDRVAQDQVVAEVETAKAVVELPSPHAGTVVRLHATEGAEVDVGAAVLTLGVGDAGAVSASAAGDAGDAPDADPARDTDAAAPFAADTADASGDAGSGTVLVGYGTANGDVRRRRRAQAHAAAVVRGGRPRAKPPVRKLAKDLGVDLAAVDGTGADARITRADVRAAAQARQDAVDARAVDAPTADVPTADAPTAARPDAAGTQRVPLSPVRARTAERLAVAWREVPAASCWVECDATALLAARDTLAAAHPDVKLTPLSLILRCCVVALRAVPELNARFDAAARALVRHDAVHLGVATQTDRGLVVPVIRDAGGHTVVGLARTLEDLAGRARTQRLTPAQLTGGTFTVSNVGAFGVDGGTPIVNHPEAAILGVGRIAPRPWVVDREVAVRDVVVLSLTFDHRVCDGAEAAGFLRMVAALVEQPVRLLAHRAR